VLSTIYESTSTPSQAKKHHNLQTANAGDAHDKAWATCYEC